MTIQREADAILEQRWEAGTQIRLNNVPMEIQGGIGYQLTNVYPRPERQGEPGPADHPFNATHTQRSWVSGQLHRDLQEAADIAVYWDGLAWVQNRGKLGAALKIRKIDLPVDAPEEARGGMIIPHKRLGQNFIFTAGNVNGAIYEFVAATRTLQNPGGGPLLSFAGTITNKGSVFQARNAADTQDERWLYLPSTAGYTRINEDFHLVQAPDLAADATVGMAIHQNKLYRLTDGGVVHTIIRHDDGGVDGWEVIAQVPDGSEPRNIYETFDDDGNRVIGVTTSSGLFLLDHDNGILWQTDLQYPEHAYQGKGATRWRADDYVSVGVGIHRRVGNLVTPEGLDNYDGLPDPLAAGFIVDLAPSYNWLLAAVAGFVPPGEDIPPIPTEELQKVSLNLPSPLLTSLDSAADFLSTNRMGAIFAWNGLGWAKVAQWNHPPTRVEVSMVKNATKGDLQQHLFYGDNAGGCYTIEIPSSYYNPLISPTLPLERQWYVEEGRLDWDTADTPKIAKQFNCKVDRLYDLMKLPGDIERPYFNEIRVICHWQDLDGIYHRSDDTSDPMYATGPWPFIGKEKHPIPYLTLNAFDAAGNSLGVFANSRQSFSIGWENYTQQGVKLATGLPHLEIWMEYQGRNDLRYEQEVVDSTIPPGRVLNELTTGILEWRTIIGRKWMRPNRVFTFVIDVQASLKGQSEEDLFGFLDACCLKVGGVPLVVNDKFYIVDVTRLDGSNDPGLSPRGSRTITCLEFTDITYEDSVAGFDPR